MVKKKISNDLKKVTAIIAGTDLRKTCEIVRKHRKLIWAIFEGSPFKKNFLVAGCTLIVKIERPIAIFTGRDS
jgi:hypothetical protein